jgi:hypothetical protein
MSDRAYISSRLFISYRREDSAGVTGRIYDRLTSHFGKDAVFKDVDSIPLGVNFKQHIDSVVNACAVTLVVIGKEWAGDVGGVGRRLDDPRDFVRLEIEAALLRGIPVIPLLVNGADMPAENALPESLRTLAYMNGMTVGHDPHFHTDIDRLIKSLETFFARQHVAGAPAHDPSVAPSAASGGLTPAQAAVGAPRPSAPAARVGGAAEDAPSLTAEDALPAPHPARPAGRRWRWFLGLLDGLSFGFRQSYNRQIINEHGVLNVSGLGLINSFALELDQVFVDLRIAPSTNPGAATMDPLARAHEARSYHGLSTAQKLVVLRCLATHMMVNRLRDVDADAAMRVIGAPLERIGITGGERETFLTNLQANSGLLLEREAGVWSFAHLTFQEYLSAAEWLERKGATPDWPALVGDGWWHETLRLYAAQGDASPLVQACLAVNSVASLMLASECVDEARELEPELRRAVTNRLLEDAEAADPVRRRFAAEVLLSRRLRSFQRIDEGRDIDLGYVTCAEYQLFLEELRGQIKYHHPDHWAGPRFPAGTAHSPVTGLRAEDAAAFCQWLTRRQGEGAAYRLPTPHEAQEYPAQVGGPAVWCGDGATYYLQGVSADAERVVRQELADASALGLPLPPLADLEAARPPARDLALAYRLSKAYLKDDNLSWVLDLALNRTRAAAMQLAPGRARELHLDTDLDLKMAGHLKRFLGQGRALNLLRTFREVKASDLRRALDLARALAFDLDLNIAPDTARAHDFDFARKLADDLAHDLARSVLYGTDIEELYNNSTNYKDEVLSEAVRQTKMSPDPGTMQLAHVLQEIVVAARAESYELAKERQRRYVLLLLEYIYVNCKRLKDEAPATVRQAKSTAEAAYFAVRSEEVLPVYWWLQITSARQAGRVPAWEGLRLVRERGPAKAA